jgi:hypothetical protein
MQQLDSISLQTAIMEDDRGEYTISLIKNLRDSKGAMLMEFTKECTDPSLSESDLSRMVDEAISAAEAVIRAVWQEVHEHSTLSID